jgi:hypothetical protein
MPACWSWSNAPQLTLLVACHFLHLWIYGNLDTSFQAMYEVHEGCHGSQYCHTLRTSTQVTCLKGTRLFICPAQI